jgi:hypothetical protein
LCWALRDKLLSLDDGTGCPFEQLILLLHLEVAQGNTPDVIYSESLSFETDDYEIEMVVKKKRRLRLIERESEN